MDMPFIRSPYNYDRMAASDDSALVIPEGEGKTIQSARDECDLNLIMKQFGVTGQLRCVDMPPLTGDFDERVTDFHSAMNLVREAEESFMRLPATVRSAFDNDAGRFVDFASDSANIEQLRLWGLAEKSSVGIDQKVDNLNSGAARSPAANAGGDGSPVGGGGSVKA